MRIAICDDMESDRAVLKNDIEACSIIGNLLDNAIEACERMNESDGKRFINFYVGPQKSNLRIFVENSYSNDLNSDGNKYRTTKKDKYRHGIGIAYIDAIVDKYRGLVMRSHDNVVFKTEIVIPLTEGEFPGKGNRRGGDETCSQV